MLGIIPAAGKGMRWGGYYKELLPLGDGRWLIDSAVEALTAGGCERICIVTAPEKAGVHATHFSKTKYNDLNIFFVINRNMHHDIFGSLEASFPYRESYNFMAFADTLIPEDAFCNLPGKPTVLGTQITTMTERFGVIDGEKVINKSAELAGREMAAWGTLTWSSEVVDYWLSLDVHDYTDAINLAIHKYGFAEKRLDYYYDFAAWGDYKCWIKSLS